MILGRPSWPSSGKKYLYYALSTFGSQRSVLSLLTTHA
jgi:hypothetical protein